LDVECGRSARRHAGRCSTGVHNPADILWHTTAWSAWAEDVASPKVTKRVGENCKLAPSTRYWGKVKFDLQRVARGENEDEVDIAEGLFLVGAGRKAEEGVPLTPDEKKEKGRKQTQKNRASKKLSPNQKTSDMPQSGGNHNTKSTEIFLDRLSSL